ncbi:MAG: hypothetical protein WBW01_19495, partial [Terriglobales bacterium]
TTVLRQSVAVSPSDRFCGGLSVESPALGLGCGSSKPRGGFEIATTSFHPTNRIPILSIGFPF